jgi:hypothetical protein
MLPQASPLIVRIVPASVVKIPTARGAVLLVALLAIALLSPAQNVVLTGSLSGRVTDQSGAVVPGASV